MVLVADRKRDAEIARTTQDQVFLSCFKPASFFAGVPDPSVVTALAWVRPRLISTQPDRCFRGQRVGAALLFYRCDVPEVSEF